MATLTETAYYTRKSLFFGVIFIIAFIILRTIVNVTKQVIIRLRPPAPAAPTVSFGKLPKPQFPESKGKDIKYKLETIQGQLPKLETVLKVYLMPKRVQNFLAIERARAKAAKMGFPGEPEQLSDSVYRWQISDEKTQKILEMDILADKFKVYYPWQTDQAILQNKYLPNLQQASSEANNFLTSNGFIESDISGGKFKIANLKYEPPNLVPALSLSGADFVRLDIFRADVDNLRVMPPSPVSSQVSFLFSGSREPSKRIVDINFTFYPIEKEIWGTYPLKSVQTAWDEAQKGEGYIASIGEIENNEAIIRKVYLAYYDPEFPTNYLQPIYVFEGDKNFFVYVSAIESKWIED